MSEEVISLDIEQIMQMLPHRYPFLLIDRVTECVTGKYAKGYKNLTMNEQFFQGHFPNKPIMPGVLQLEAMAQMGASILLTNPEYKDAKKQYKKYERVIIDCKWQMKRIDMLLEECNKWTAADWLHCADYNWEPIELNVVRPVNEEEDWQ